MELFRFNTSFSVGDSDLARNFIKVSKSILEYVENKQDLQERVSSSLTFPFYDKEIVRRIDDN